MAVYVANLNIEQGANFKVSFNIEDPGTNSPLSLVGYAASARLRKTYSSTGFTSFTTTVSDPTNGVITIALSHDETAALKAGRHVYDVIILSPISADPPNYTTRVVEGSAIVRPSATRF